MLDFKINRLELWIIAIKAFSRCVFDCLVILQSIEFLFNVTRFLFGSIRSFRALYPFRAPKFSLGRPTEKYLILNGMHRSDSAYIRRLNGIHNTLPVASGRLRIGWNAASWPRPNPLFHSFRIHPLCTIVCSLAPQNHPECTLRGTQCHTHHCHRHR